MLALQFSKKTLALVALLAAFAGVLLIAANVSAQSEEDCENCQTSLSVSAAAGPCVPAGQKTGVITVSLKNPTLQRDIKDVAVSVDGKVKTVDVDADSSKNVDFDGLAAGTYDVKAKDVVSRTDFEDEVTLEECPEAGRGAVESAAAPAAPAAEKLPISGPEVALQFIAAAIAGGTGFAIARKRL